MTDIPYLQESATFMLGVQKEVDGAEAAVRVIDDEISVFTAQISSRQNRRADLLKIVVPGRRLLTGGPTEGPTLTGKPQIEKPTEEPAPPAAGLVGVPLDGRSVITRYATWLTTRPGAIMVGALGESPVLFATIDEYLALPGTP